MGKIERIAVPAEDRERLRRLARDRNTPQKVVWRAHKGVRLIRIDAGFGKPGHQLGKRRIEIMERPGGN